MDEIEGDWFLQEYVNSHDGKPTGAHQPYLCPESRMTFMPNITAKSMNVSQISYEWPVTFLDVVEWVQHPKKSGVFFHEENIFSLWTMKVMEVDARKHMVIFLCIDYTIWPGWNHRGVYLLSREQVFKVRNMALFSSSFFLRMKCLKNMLLPLITHDATLTHSLGKNQTQAVRQSSPQNANGI